VAVAVATIGLLGLAPAAGADLSFCPPGTGAGQCSQPAGVAVDAETGHLYIVDSGNNRVDVFAADGSFLLAFGWGVKDESAELQSCTAVSGCRKGLPGPGTGQFSAPKTIAVDNDPASPARHDVYVGTDNFRVQRFDPEGHFLLGFGWGVADGVAKAETCGPDASPPTAACLAGLEGKGECQPGGSAHAGLIAVGPGGAVSVADSFQLAKKSVKGRIEKFDSSGACVGESVLFEGQNQVLSGAAVDSGGDTYVIFERGGGVIRRYDPSGNVLCEIDQNTESTALAIDPSDDLFAAQREARSRGGGSYRVITEYDPSCNHLRRFGYGAVEQAVQGLAAFHSANGDVFASEEGKGVHDLPLPPSGPLVASNEANPVSNTKATLIAEVNPEGKESKYHFEYVEEATYQKDVDELGAGHGFDHAIRTPASPAADPSAGSDFKLHTAEALAGCPEPAKEAGSGTCLTPETDYRFRIVVENEAGNGNSPIEGKFTTKPPLEFGEFWTTAVGVDTAQLHGEVNPLGIPTSGYFEYVDDATYGKDVEELGEGHGFDHAQQSPNVAGGEAPIDFGDGEALTARSTSLFPLSPGTTYHYRLVVEDPLIAPTTGPERTFKTATKPPQEACPSNEAFRTGPSAPLPDCRAYEMVSPLDKDNGDIVVVKETSTNLPTVLDQSSIGGSKLAYGSYRAFGDAQSGPITSQYIAARGKEGWESHGISPPRGRPLFPDVTPSLDTEFKVFSPDLCDAWLRTVADPPLAAGAREGYPNLYRRVDGECGGPSYETLTTAEWLNLPPRKDPEDTGMELQGVSADGSHTIFIAPDSLAGSGAPDLGGGAGHFQLYVWAGGPTPVFVCVLPDGEALQTPCSGGTNVADRIGRNRSASVHNAVSADGSRIFWTASASGPGKIYMREHAEQGQVAGECGAGKACTIAVSEEAETLSGTTKSQFLSATRDGSKAIFTTGENPSTGGDLYEFDVATKTTRLIAHRVVNQLGAGGLLGASEDASYVYFASTAVLGGQNSEGDVAQVDKPNLYVDHEGALSFIGTLSDHEGNLEATPIAREPRFHLARVSPDGLHAAFMSNAPLTDYDNTDANSGEADAEVFLYDATANGGAGKLICASCNPSGSRPAGANVGSSTIIPGPPLWAAAQIPVYENTLYAARVLSDDGRRLFFGSSDALVAGDTNGIQDVYEWEAVGAGSCKESSPAFSKQDEGCIALISSGQSGKDSEFLDASPSGDDVFFTTLSSLVPQDYGLVDVYDARVGGGFPSSQSGAEECEGEACQSPPVPPPPPTPATSILGPSGQALPHAKGCDRNRRAVGRKGKRRCVPERKKRNHKRHSKRRAKP
jgi:hypothetical protein